MQTERTIAARLTPNIPAGIATIAVRGVSAVDTVLACTQMKVRRLDLGRVHYGTFAVVSSGEKSGEQVVVCRTSEEQVEVHCHGGNAVCQAILERLRGHGCECIEARDWPSDLDCPIGRSAETDLQFAITDKAANVLVDQLDGALRHSIDSALQLLQEKKHGAALACLQVLFGRRDFGLHLVAPWKIVFAGPPNVGKSSLMNSIVGQARSIVHHEAGTTRDWIEAQAAIDGWPVALTDTAGIRDGDEWVEKEGVRRAKERVAVADLLVVVVDACVGWTDVHRELLELPVSRRLIAWNKSDLYEGEEFHGMDLPLATNTIILPTSSVSVGGTDSLLQAISQQLVPEVPGSGVAVPFRSEHFVRIKSAIEFLRQEDGAAAILELRKLIE